MTEQTKYSVPDDHWSEDDETGADQDPQVIVKRHTIQVDDLRTSTGYEYGIQWIFSIEEHAVIGWTKSHYLEGRTQADYMHSPEWANIPHAVRDHVATELGHDRVADVAVDAPDFYGTDDETEETECELCGATTEDPTLTSDSHAAGPNLVVCDQCKSIQPDGGSLDGTVDTDRLERAQSLVEEATGDSKVVDAQLALAHDAIATAREGNTAKAVSWALDDAEHHLRGAEELTRSNDVFVPVRNALQLVADARGGGRRV